MIAVYKYEINPYEIPIKMPKGAEILHAGFQDGLFCLWAKIDTEAEIESRLFYAFPTGGEIPQHMGTDWEYINTGFLDGLVFHCFERTGL